MDEKNYMSPGYIFMLFALQNNDQHQQYVEILKIRYNLCRLHQLLVT